MSGLRWHDNYSVGVAAVDDEHKHIITMINDTYTASPEGGDNGAAAKILHEMSSYAAVHFEREERYMEENGYPEVVAHKSEHQYFVEKIELYEKAKAADKLDAMELRRFLSGWLISHIMNCDKKLGSFLVEKGVQ